ncbi:TrkH family potassium uptake protein [Thiorhodovibrio frisius]|uniref:Trk system potassium uptake protein n=1 Tax=Thiorhodovibrio frisius TaxID=631362 RepID=H8Z123_9GAMM|nr:TrkH family potassium uptake protein [Thiorhodovibrio frisius]EIC22444.1 potassium uptake protein, TrkH family [Thiorhodovibrio frisius]WPL24745.1 Trk system potassium uptake protein TrkH [Thiorhodovibrio frisius]
MHWRAIFRLFGILLMLYSLSFLPSLGVSLFYGDGQWEVFGLSVLVSTLVGGVLWLPNMRAKSSLTVREGFLIVTLFWVVLGLVGALPFLLGLELSLTDAVFESISGFTTTGATVIIGLDELPKSILYHRQQIQWLGGMGIIVLAVAILPLMGVGGMQLYRAEASGVAKYEKPTPRMAETARALWLLYFGLTLTCALFYWFAGMTGFDAIGHAFSTVATGGFSTHDASFSYFNSLTIETIATVFMLIGGVNFVVHFIAWRKHDLKIYITDPEVRTYGLIFLGGASVVALSLWWAGVYGDGWEAWRYAAFQSASVLTGTGYSTATFAAWPLHVPMSLVILAFVGGCGGSTAGGLKVLRVMLLAKLGVRQLFQLAHPQAMATIKIGKRPVRDDVLFSVWGFYVLYIVTALLLTLAMMATGLELETAFGAVVATINLLGPGLGEVATSFTTMDPVVKWLGVFGMLAGRLEIFTLLILFLPAYWRH